MSVGGAVLIVDDNAVNVMILEAMVTKAGYHPVVARSGAEGVERALSERPRAVLMDINMPGMSGTEATHALRTRDPAFSVPVIAVTAGLTATQRDACLAAGFACILLKPLEYGELVATLARLAA